jgi:hypothetical protein
VVYEVTEAGRRPIEGASVGWEASLDLVVADTWSDAAGRYVLCGLPAGPVVGLFADKEGFTVDYASAEAGDSTVDIEMRRR